MCIFNSKDCPQCQWTNLPKKDGIYQCYICNNKYEKYDFKIRQTQSELSSKGRRA